jgi:hypothetical protein
MFDRVLHLALPSFRKRNRRRARALLIKIGFAPDTHGRKGAMFVIYSNRIGCVGSILISLVLTLILGGVFWLLSTR